MDRYYKKRFVPLALPALILFVMVIVIPFIMGVIYSFTAWRGTYFAGGDHFWEAFVGFDNYVKLFFASKAIAQIYGAGPWLHKREEVAALPVDAVD